MSIFPASSLAKVPKTKHVATIALFYACLLVVMAVAQLFTFDEFLMLFEGSEHPGGIQSAYVLCAFLVFAEVFALPFLLRMSLSHAFRWLSMILGWCVALIWTVLTVWMAIGEGATDNVGFLGSIVTLTPGWWAVFMSISFGVLAAWASWGMWPGAFRRRAKKTSKPTKSI